jgi:hypothetical protein
MKLTRHEIINFNSGLAAVGDLGGALFAYCVARNISQLKPEIEALQKAHAPTEEFIAYDKERSELAKKHAVKVKGEPQTKVVNGVQEYVIEDREKFNKEWDVLKKKHIEVIDKRAKQLKEIEEFLKQEVEIIIHKVSPKYIPEGITANQITGILPMIDDELEKVDKITN